uniref:Uncharacterized protein n=1 Tax=Opuntia streptacantha TaxID=393608 RepID=A0A7C9DU55_OPUST
MGNGGFSTGFGVGSKSSSKFSWELVTLGCWLQSPGDFRGLKVKNPAEKMCFPRFLSSRWIADELAVEATAQYGSLLFTSFTLHPLISLTCLLTEKGRTTSNFPWLLVFTS